jgi:hypothetical protein
VWRPPYTARQAKLYGFVLRADPSAIDALLRRDLVTPAGGVLDYRCAHENVIVSFAEIDRLGSGDSVDKLRGYLPELEVAIWCLVADLSATGRLLWHIPYVFTDSGQTVASGREVFGYPKQIGSFNAGFLDQLDNGGTASVDALAIDPYGPNQPAMRKPMIAAERLGAPAQQPAAASWIAELESWFPGGFDVTPNLATGPSPSGSATIQPSGAPPPPPPAAVPPWITGVLNSLQGKSLTGSPDDLAKDLIGNPNLVFLKQFRDATCPTKACFQSIIEAPIALDLTGAGYEALDPAQFRVTINEYESQPMASDLGIAAGARLVPSRVFKATFGFDVLLGLEVWRAPT